jgi:diguanylate cyclase (GGDEF)-like protein
MGVMVRRGVSEMMLNARKGSRRRSEMTTVRSEERPLRSTVARFAVVTLLPILVLGWFLDSTVRHTIEHRTADVYGGMTTAMFRMASDAIVSKEDMTRGTALPPERSSVIDYLIKQVGADPTDVRVRIIDLDRHVLYANQTADRTDTDAVADSPELQKAFGGRTATKYLRGTLTPGSTEERDLIELSIPIRFGEDRTVYGAIIASGIDGTVVQSIDRDVRRMQTSLVIALLGLWLALLPIASSVSRSLRRHAAANRHLALHDTLTGLPNRNLLQDQLARRLQAGGELGLLLIDLDRFKDVNDTLGHGTGDHLLQGVAERLVASVRSGDTVARLGGDEFAVVIGRQHGSEVGVSAALEAVAARVTESLVNPFLLDGIEVAIEASIGGAVHGGADNPNPVDADLLLQHADIAMYAAKSNHDTYVEYRPDLDSHSPRRLALAADLGRALAADDQLVLHYQPVASPTTGEVESMEALLRWYHPTLGLLPPTDFIPMAEQSGMMRLLSAKVLDLALAQTRSWLDAGLDLSVAVNLSAADLRSTTLADEVLAALDAHGVPATRLELEVTETALLSSPDAAVSMVSMLRAHGVRIALDDFGTGYSSLTYLKDLSPDRLKIDRSFVDAMTHDPTDAEIVRSIISLAHSLRIGVTAEGVETRDHWELLRDLSCDLVQGYFLARPLPADEAIAWVAGHARQERQVELVG